MTEDVACDVCVTSHEATIPARLHGSGVPSTAYSGLDVIQQQQLRQQMEVDQYCSHLVGLRGVCVACRVSGKAWEHGFSSCVKRHAIIAARRTVQQEAQEGG